MRVLNIFGISIFKPKLKDSIFNFHKINIATKAPFIFMTASQIKKH